MQWNEIYESSYEGRIDISPRFAKFHYSSPRFMRYFSPLDDYFDERLLINDRLTPRRRAGGGTGIILDDQRRPSIPRFYIRHAI